MELFLQLVSSSNAAGPMITYFGHCKIGVETMCFRRAIIKSLKKGILWDISIRIHTIWVLVLYKNRKFPFPCCWNLFLLLMFFQADPDTGFPLTWTNGALSLALWVAGPGHWTGFSALSFGDQQS